jgi:hypothetical protein
MKLALERLGLGPCHHMSEVMAHPAQKVTWRSIAQGNTPDWEEAFAGYQSCLDWPSAHYWRQLSNYYPSAKILLTVRDAASWYESMVDTIFRVLNRSTDPESVGLALIASKVFAGKTDDRQHVIETFERNTAEVQAAFGEDRLLVFAIGDGWEPLCRFLGKPVPDVPFPRSNSRAEFNSIAGS